MKITKKRLLQIIREELELHEKNTFELEEEELEEISKEDGKKAIDDEVESDKEVGNLEELGIELEDKLFDPKTKKPLNNKKQNDI